MFPSPPTPFQNEFALISITTPGLYTVCKLWKQIREINYEKKKCFNYILIQLIRAKKMFVLKSIWKNKEKKNLNKNLIEMVFLF